MTDLPWASETSSSTAPPLASFGSGFGRIVTLYRPSPALYRIREENRCPFFSSDNATGPHLQVDPADVGVLADARAVPVDEVTLSFVTGMHRPYRNSQSKRERGGTMPKGPRLSSAGRPRAGRARTRRPHLRAAPRLSSLPGLWERCGGWMESAME
jgi:hypothetical protein